MIVGFMFLSSLATGVYEEFIFRGIAFGALLRLGLGVKWAILASAILFAVFHMFDISSYVTSAIVLKLINTFVMGVVFAYTYHATKSILYVMAIHTVWDMEFLIQRAYAPEDIALGLAVLLFVMSIIYCFWSCKSAANEYLT